MEIKNKLQWEFFYKAYADDLVLIIRHIKLLTTIRHVKEISEKNNLKFNSKKSNWIKIKNHKGVEYTPEHTHNVLKAKSYNYLGINIDDSGNIDFKN